MNKIFKYSFLGVVGSFLSLFLFVGQASAEIVSVSCSGTSGAPTAVTEADLDADDVTFTNGGGSGWCVLDNSISAASVVINTGVTITHTAADTDGVTISTTGDLEIQSGAYINVDSKGCQDSTGDDDGYGPDASNACSYQGTGSGKGKSGVTAVGASGAGHGGPGGKGTYTSYTAGSYFGTNTAPTRFGASGGTAWGVAGGAGGGFVRLNVTGTLTNNGSVSANGGNGGSGSSSSASGGGSGGSVYITAGTIAGTTGTFSANGGNGYDGASTHNGGGGSGGRIAIIYTSATFSFSSSNVLNTAGLGPDTAEDGAKGTAYVEDSDDHTITIFNGFDYTTDYSEASWTVDSSATNQYCDGSTDPTPSITTTGAIVFSGTLSCTNSSVTGFDTSAGSSITMTGFTFSMNAISAAGAAVPYKVILWTIDDAIPVVLQSTTTISANTQWTNLSSLSIDATSAISANGLGCPGQANADGWGPDSNNVCGHNGGWGDGQNSDGGYQGAGHGGAGGVGSSASYNTGGATYGSSTEPVLLGSSGGGTAGTTLSAGGNGGGLIRIDVNGTFQLEGALSADGGDGDGNNSSRSSGGGSGGSIYVSTDLISGTTGSFSADGGDGANHTTDGGGGGGGRVAIVYGSDVSSFLSGLSAATVTIGGSGPDTAADGTVGTLSAVQVVYVESILITDNSGYTNDSTPAITVTESGATPTYIALSCNNTDWSDWLAYTRGQVVNSDGPVFDITNGATNCTSADGSKTIYAKIKDGSSTSSVVSDTTTYDTVGPTVSNVSATNPNATYGATDVISVTVQFDESMAVTGTPQIELDMDQTDRQANYDSLSTDTLTFTYTIVNGDNKTDLDYTGTGALTLNGGTIKDLAGNNATLTLASPGAASSLGANKEINIVTLPTVNWSSSSQSGAEGVGTLTVTAELTFSYASDVTIPYTYATGTATETSDFTISASPLVITAGNTTGNVTITVVDDVIDELDETVITIMGAPTNAIKGATDTHTATITDNDAAPTISINDPTVSESAGTGTVTVTLTGGSYLGVTVDYATSDGTAVAGSDYTAASGTLTWAADETGTKTFNVTITDDVLDENDETVSLGLSNPTNSSISDSSGILTITDNDAAPTISFSSGTASGSEATTPASFIATLSSASGKTITVDYATADSTALAGSDYTAASGTLTFSPGETEKTVNVTITDDALDEADEVFDFDLSSLVNVSSGTYLSVAYTITDNDAAPTISFSSGTASGSEATTPASFIATLSSASGKTITVDYATADSTALAGSDYTAASGTLTFSPGETEKTVNVTITDDALDEADEVFDFDLSSLVNVSSGTYLSVAYTITDNDAAPTVSWTASAQAVLEDDTTMTVTAELSAVSGLTVTIPYTVTGTATDDLDYTITASPITITAGQTTSTITITIIEDPIVEPDETVIITMDSPTNASQGATTIHTATITRDDANKNYTAPATTVGQSQNNSVTVIAPSDGEEISENTFKTITWSTSGFFSFVNLYYSLDNGQTFILIERNLVNIGHYSWLIPSEVGASVIIKIEGTDLVSVLASDTATFSIVDGVFVEEIVPETEEETLPEATVPTEEEAEQEINIIGIALEGVLGDRWSQQAAKQGIAEIFPNFPESVAVGTLIKLPDDSDPSTQLDTAVYYVGADKRRHPFPNEAVYKSWFSTFYGIKIVDAQTMAEIPIGPMVTYRPGSTLVKFLSENRVYSVDATGALRWITSESLAQSLYGDDWSKLIQDIFDGFRPSYAFGDQLASLTDQTWDNVIASF